MQLEPEGFHNSAVLVADFELCFPSMAGKNSEREELWAKRRDQIFGRPWDRGTFLVAAAGVGYPLVNSHNHGKSPCFMGKSTINGDFL